MNRAYRRFVGENWRTLGFGVLLMGLSSFGQTFFISVFGAEIRRSYGLSDGGLGAIYAGATLCSAATMAWMGHLVSVYPLRRFTAAAATGLGLACLLMSVSPNVATLGLSFYLLRLTGQGMMVHTAYTAMARALPSDRGKGIGIAALGLPVAEATLPWLAVHGMQAIGWRPLWAAQASIVLIGAAVALILLGRTPAHPAPKGAAGLAAGRLPWSTLWRDPRFALSVPLLMCSPFVSTGFIFHQARLAQEKGWPVGAIAAGFAAYAAARASSLLLIGPLLDRLSAVRLLPWLALPLLFALLLLAGFDARATVPAYLLLFGLSGSVSSMLGTALWAEIYGTARLGHVRALTEAGNVMASGLAPLVMGLLIDAGIALRWQALAMLAGVAAAGLMAREASRRAAQAAAAAEAL
jgi:MFS family permease